MLLTVGAFNDPEIFRNLLVRFSEGEIEKPTDLRVTGKKIKEAHAVQGWKMANSRIPDLSVVKGTSASER